MYEIMKINNWNYQRNGVSGEGFFQLLYHKKEKGFGKEMLFIATFTTMNDSKPDECINWISCRVVTPLHPYLAWRGDVIASELNDELQNMFGKIEGYPGRTFYDLMLIYKSH